MSELRLAPLSKIRMVMMTTRQTWLLLSISNGFLPLLLLIKMVMISSKKEKQLMNQLFVTEQVFRHLLFPITAKNVIVVNTNNWRVPERL